MAMPIAIILVGIIVQGLSVAAHSQVDVERRTNALSQGQIGLERMSRELRQAEWLYFRSSAVVDIDALVRPAPTSKAAHRLVRYDCSGIACVRSEGPPVAYPPPASPVFTKSLTVIGTPAGDTRTRYGKVTAHDVFTPRRLDPTTGQPIVDFVDPTHIAIRLQLKVKGRTTPIELEDGVTLRNRSAFG